MSKQYGLHFGPTFLSATSGLAPTFINFVRLDTGTTLTPPGITQIIAGIGMYKFAYTPSFPVYFEVDGATTGLGAYRYIQGTLDNIDQIDDLLSFQGTTLQAVGATILQGQVNMGITLVAIGNTGTVGVGSLLASIGSTASSFGTNVIDPSTLYGFLKRLQEDLEGDGNYNKSSGIWTMYNRTGGTTLAIKTLTDTASDVTKT